MCVQWSQQLLGFRVCGTYEGEHPISPSRLVIPDESNGSWGMTEAGLEESTAHDILQCHQAGLVSQEIVVKLQTQKVRQW